MNTDIATWLIWIVGIGLVVWLVWIFVKKSRSGGGDTIEAEPRRDVSHKRGGGPAAKGAAEEIQEKQGRTDETTPGRRQ